jgi:hypothetical protein
MHHTDDSIPHMTITEGISGPTVNEELLERLQATARCGTFPCNELAYIVPNEKFKFGVMTTLPLMNERNRDSA